METQNFLLEIGTEEIPAGYIPPAESQIKQFSFDWLSEKKITHKQITSFGTPRRLTLFVPDIAEKQDIEEKLILGPPARIAYD